MRTDVAMDALTISDTERLDTAGIEAAIGSRCDAYDNALAESVIGLFRTRVIRHVGLRRSVDDVEYATLDLSGGSTPPGCSNRWAI